MVSVSALASISNGWPRFLPTPSWSEMSFSPFALPPMFRIRWPPEFVMPCHLDPKEKIPRLYHLLVGRLIIGVTPFHQPPAPHGKPVRVTQLWFGAAMTATEERSIQV